ncbi:hypothetical protein Smic_19720 [Streptomyces microflavus]|uniref:Uncharacterized protein n=1 Tax=Streptomyces microflavus TaxID=1919 RepID=A0A7J0CLQ3_STRMI|nr:hypothetical protein Smic_19720 [Streptomyces microflavus]
MRPGLPARQLRTLKAELYDPSAIGTRSVISSRRMVVGRRRECPDTGSARAGIGHSGDRAIRRLRARRVSRAAPETSTTVRRRGRAMGQDVPVVRASAASAAGEWAR